MIKFNVFTGTFEDVPNLLPSNNVWTGTNTFQNHVIGNTSTDNTTFYPYLDQYYSGFLPHGRNVYGHETAASDNPDAVHSYIRRSINQIPLGGSDDGTGCYIADQLELRYQGAAVTTITSITVAAGVGTFVVASTSALYKREGIAVRGNGNSTYNTYWIITGITNSTTFTAIWSSGTAGTGSGNGGDIRAEANEWNAAASGYRYIYVYSHNANPTQSGQMSVGYPLSVLPPQDFACGGGNAQASFLVSGSQSVTSGAGGTNVYVVNNDPSSATSVFALQNPLTNHAWTEIIDPTSNGSDTFKMLHGANTFLSSVVGGTRFVLGAGTGSDDGATKFQFIGSVLGSTTLKIGSTFTQTGGSGQFTITPGSGSIPDFSPFTATDTNSGTAITAYGNNNAITANRTSATNGGAQQTAIVIGGSPASSPASYSQGWYLGTGWSGNAITTAIVTTNNVPLDLFCTTRFSVHTGGVEALDVFSNLVECVALQSDGVSDLTGGRLKIGVSVVAAGQTLTSTSKPVQTYTGSGDTWNLPTVTGTTGLIFKIKNRGSGNITLASNSGSQIYTTSAQASVTIAAGAALTVINDGTYFVTFP